MRHTWLGALLIGVLPAISSAHTHFGFGFRIGIPTVGIGFRSYDYCYRPYYHRYYAPSYYSTVYVDPAPVYVAPPPVVYEQPPVVYSPPVVYAPPAPVYVPARSYYRAIAPAPYYPTRVHYYYYGR